MGGEGTRLGRKVSELSRPPLRPHPSLSPECPGPGLPWGPSPPTPSAAPGAGLELPSLPAQGHLPWTPRVPLSPAHLGADVLIGGRADEGEADEEDVLGTE